MRQTLQVCSSLSSKLLSRGRGEALAGLAGETKGVGSTVPCVYLGHCVFLWVRKVGAYDPRLWGPLSPLRCSDAPHQNVVVFTMPPAGKLGVSSPC